MKFAVAIVGGLGNQLFCLAYALEQHAKGHEVKILPSIRKSQTRQHSQHFSILSHAGRDFLGVPILGRLEKSLLQFRNFLRAIAHGVGLKSILLGIETRNEISDTSLPLRDAKLVRGYFQNPGVSNQTLETLRDGLFPKDGNLSHLVQAEIFIHYRRGDYTSHKQSIGLLDDMYFVGAAKSARSATGIIRVRIFSDGDPNELKIRLEEIGFIVEVFEDGGLDPFEALSTLVSSRGPLITSNSSFSWWAAALSEADRLVFYPMPWFRDGSLHDMGRKGWTSLEHDWSD